MSSVHFDAWKVKRKWFLIKYTIEACLLHIPLLIFGRKRLISLLSKFHKPIVKYYINNEQDIKILKKQIHPIFKKIRTSKYHWSNCLSSSILLWHILKSQGLDTQIVIGTSKEYQQFKAHAWVEYKQMPLNENWKIRKKFCTFDYNFSKNNNL